jgi:hypothetical protein
MPVSTTIIITSIIGAATGIGSAANSAKNQKLRREYEQNLAALDLEEKKRLEKKLLASRTLEEKKRVLAETLGKVTETRIKAIEEQKMESQKTLNRLILIGGVSVAILIVGLIVYSKRSKK